MELNVHFCNSNSVQLLMIKNIYMCRSKHPCLCGLLGKTHFTFMNGSWKCLSDVHFKMQITWIKYLQGSRIAHNSN